MQISKLLLLVSLSSPACILPFVVPPSKIDTSIGTQLSRNQTPQPALHLNAGLSLNAIQLDPQYPTDIQVGYALHVPFERGDAAQGVYGAVSLFAPVSSHFRWEVGGRAEALVDTVGNVGFGTFLHLGGEGFGSGTGPFESSSSDGVIFGSSYGTGGIGFFLDAGRIQGLDTEAVTFVSGGLSFSEYQPQ